MARHIRIFLGLFLVVFFCKRSYGQQQDVDFHLSSHLLQGQKVLKVKRDFNDIYLWALAQNNKVYRINSETLVVDDYTAKFAAYHNFQFIDIAGRSQDTVFVATSSPNVIEYKNGTLRDIGSADGIPGNVNSIGMRAGLQVYTAINHNNNSTNLAIASKAGYRLYNIVTETIYPLLADPSSVDIESNTGDSKIYEATYRTEFFKDSLAQSSDIVKNDTVSYQPVVFLEEGVINIGDIWEGGNEFGSINTGISVYTDIYSPMTRDGNLFWGTNKGMFQCWWNFSYYARQDAQASYLKGISVNKITTIYGLTTFGQAFYYGDPGLIKQNLLIGTDNGLYFSSSIYSGYENPLRNFALFHDDELGTGPINDICVNVVPKSYPTCENGAWIAANDGLYLVKPDYGAYLSQQTLTAVNFKNQPTTVTETELCADSSVTAVIDTLTYTGGDVQWYKDGNELAGQSADSLIIKSSGNYHAVLYDPCAGSSVKSNQLKVDTISAPVFTFNYPDELNYCSGSPAGLKVQGNTAYLYRWYKDGVLNGVTSDTITITQNGKYKAEVSACSGAWVPTKEVQVNFIQLPVPAIISDKPAYCIGDEASLSLNVASDAGYTINWLKDGNEIASYQNKTTITTDTVGSYSVTLTSAVLPDCIQFATPMQVNFNPPPSINVQEIVNNNLCTGQTIQLKANYTNGTIKWSTGETTDEINVTNNGDYKATVTTSAGCTADTTIHVQFLQNPVLAVNDTSLCEFSRQSVTLTAPTGYSSYVWNGQQGDNLFKVSSPQTVNLTVTDINGCQASQQIKVSDQCADILIPNAFTPNGDGINDTWDISGINGDLSVSVKIFNRYGISVYQSKGLYTPWNGLYNGKRLPTGVYYYIITTKNGQQKFSGSLTIIY
jgi:gliding motility-associated-like protein